jgi:DNA-binding transcriptional ArsR family regulator
MGEQLDLAFGALSDPSRRAILRQLGSGDRRITDIARGFPCSLNTVSKHVRVLERAGLVRRRVRGREHRIALEPGALDAAAAWIAESRAFWEPRLDALAAMLGDGRGRGD